MPLFRVQGKLVRYLNYLSVRFGMVLALPPTHPDVASKAVFSSLKRLLSEAWTDNKHEPVLENSTALLSTHMPVIAIHSQKRSLQP